MTPERPYKEIAHRLAVDWTSTRSREKCAREIESAVNQAVKEKEEEIFRLNHAYDYLNARYRELQKEIQGLKEGR